MGKDLALGEQEADLLRYVTDHAPTSVREVADDWGAPRGLARTTVLTMMERLRKKNFLAREKGPDRSALQYSPVQPKTDLMRSLVQDFVKNKLGGSIEPFVAYLAESPELSKSEVAELKRLVEGIGESSRTAPQ
jgi:predicted transcriptional regulator